jgi:hypothetical protein
MFDIKRRLTKKECYYSNTELERNMSPNNLDEKFAGISVSISNRFVGGSYFS